MCDGETAFHHEGIKIATRFSSVVVGKCIVFDRTILHVWWVTDDDVESAMCDGDGIELGEPVEGAGGGFPCGKTSVVI